MTRARACGLRPLPPLRKAAGRLAVGLAVGLAAIPVLSSCAGMQGLVPTADAELRVRIAAEPELRDRFGRTAKINPFLPPSSTFRGRTSEFWVLLFEASGPVRLEIAGIARAERPAEDGGLTGTAGTELPPGSVLGRDELRRFWEARTEDDGSPESAAENQRKAAAIDRHALDLYGLNVLKGRSPYILVVLVPAGNADPADLVARFYLNGEYRESGLIF